MYFPMGTVLDIFVTHFYKTIIWGMDLSSIAFFFRIILMFQYCNLYIRYKKVA